MTRLAIALLCLLSVAAEAAEWQFVGPSSAGNHYADRASVQWDADKAAFSILTNVIQPDQSEWFTTLRIDCKANRYAYLNGVKLVEEAIVSEFDEPRPEERIAPDSMPEKLEREYCDSGKARVAQWESLGKSKIAEVFYDKASIRQSQDGARFIADTRVVPFSKQPATLSTIAFNCNDDTFTVMKLGRWQNGKLDAVFDKPQPATPTSKTATLQTLSRKFCKAK